MPLHCSFVLLCNPKGLLHLLPLLSIHSGTDNFWRKVLVQPTSHPQLAWKHCIRSPIVDIIFKMLFCWMTVPVWISSFSVGQSRIWLLVLWNSLVVKVNLRSLSIYFLLEIINVGCKVFQWVDTKTNIRRMDVLDVHALEAGVNIPQFLLEHFLPITLFSFH